MVTALSAGAGPEGAATYNVEDPYTATDPDVTPQVGHDGMRLHPRVAQARKPACIMLSC